MYAFVRIIALMILFAVVAPSAAEAQFCCGPAPGQCDPFAGDPFTQCQQFGGAVTNDCQYCIPPEIDCLDTTCGQSKFSFCDTPIPAGFFDPNSEQFDGAIFFQGQSGSADTRVQRFDPMVLEVPGQVAATQIELVQLDLVSCNPITVVIDGGPVEWDVAVTLDPNGGSAGVGQMVVEKTHASGGSFSSDFFVRPQFVFTRTVAPFDSVILAPGLIEPMGSTGYSPWVHTADPNEYAPAAGCTADNFIPGAADGGDPNGPPGACIPPAGTVCQIDVGHAGPNGSLHVTGQAIVPCTCGACCDPLDGSCTVFSGATPAADCAAASRDYKGDGTTCDDRDNDGIPDVQESHACCEAKDNCNTGSDPANPDTDGDGLLDGVDPDPCVPTVVPVAPVPWTTYSIVGLLGLMVLGVLFRRRWAAA